MVKPAAVRVLATFVIFLDRSPYRFIDFDSGLFAGLQAEEGILAVGIVSDSLKPRDRDASLHITPALQFVAVHHARLNQPVDVVLDQGKIDALARRREDHR